MMKRSGLFVTAFFLTLVVSAQQRPRIGVTLSGGGAKGLAHIGILKAIDSAGLQVSYVSGTSMGNIIGALYASGYSADSIEKIARKTDWDILLSNAASLSNLSMDEKNEYDKYAAELPWKNNGFRLPSGLLESEEIWLLLSQYLFPVYNINDFSKLPRGFACIATDVSNGEAVELTSGDLVQAVRSSMAIPSLFTAVNYNGRKFVDGGIVKNFPVSSAKKLGADFVIGSNVAGGLLPKEKINNVFQVMMQVAFFREDADIKKEKSLCDVYILHKLDEYNMGSFGSVAEIIDAGIRHGDSLYPYLKHIADSLNNKYGVLPPQKNLLPVVDSIFIAAYEVQGLEKTNESFLLHRLQFEKNKWYTAKTLGNKIRRAFGTRYYNKIIYSLQPLPDGSSKIIFTVEENPLTYTKLGVHYNSFTGISLIANLTSKNFFTPFSRSMVTVNVGENMRIYGEHIQNFGKFKTLALAACVQAEQIKFTSYNDFKKQGTFKQANLTTDVNIHWVVMRNYSFGLGTRFDVTHFKPDIPSSFYIRGNNSYVTAYGFLKMNTLTNNVYPKKGLRINAEMGYVFNQAPHLTYYDNGKLIRNFDSLNFKFENYWKLTASIETFHPVSRKVVFFTHAQAAMNFKQKASLVNDFYIGGLNKTFSNQVLFTGLNENSIYSSSAMVMQIGWRYAVYPSLYITAKGNAMYYNFINSNRNTTPARFITGYGISLGYNFVLGPLEISAMYCDQSKKLLPYINLGIPF